jgi:hypothetical protein
MEDLLEFAPALRDCGAAFQQNGSQLINQRNALAHQSIAGPVQGPHVELLLALHFDEPHRWSRCRLRNRFVVGADILR